MKVWEGDSWKSADKGAPAEPLTRPEIQSQLNTEFALGVISRAAWRRQTDALSGCDFQGKPYATGKETP